jgi:hypothetical protein
MDRRKHPRIPVEHLMEARLVAGELESVGRVIDLNNAGAFVATDLPLDKNARLEVELAVPGVEKSLPLKAVVARRTEAVEGQRRVMPAGLGLVFMAENVMERSFIQMAVLEALKVSLKRMAKPAAG